MYVSFVAKAVASPLLDGVGENVSLLDLEVGLVYLALTLLQVVLEILHLLDGELLLLFGLSFLVSAILVLFVDFFELLQLLSEVAHTAAAVVLDAFGTLAFGLVVEGSLGELPQGFNFHLACFDAVTASLVGSFVFGVGTRYIVDGIGYFVFEFSLVLDILLDELLELCDCLVDVVFVFLVVLFQLLLKFLAQLFFDYLLNSVHTMPTPQLFKHLSALFL